MRTTMLAVMATVLFCAGGCAHDRQLHKRLDALEQELADSRASQRRLAQRLDEVQIQLATLARHLAPPAKNMIEGPADQRLEVPVAAGNNQAAGEGLDEEQIAGLLDAAAGLLREGRRDQAEARLSLFLERFADHPLAARAYLLRGKIRFRDGRFDVARTDFQSALSLTGEDKEQAAEALLFAGRCDEHLGHLQEAKNTYLQLVQAYPLTQQATEANKRLEVIR